MVLHRVLFVIACLILPIAWGVGVNSLFDLWQNRNSASGEDDSIFPDYQI